MKKDPPMWIAVDFECMDVPRQNVETTNEKLFVGKLLSIGYIIVRKPLLW